jgi:thiol-disulfide isomerase/thioredoxin
MKRFHSGIRSVWVSCLLAAGVLPPCHLNATPGRPRAASQGPTLKVGDPAPAIQVGRWLKGTPVTQFQPGNVYVLECWATWCGPCKQAIPHVTELARKFEGKATFIGVDVWEKGKDPEKIDREVEAFVSEMGPRMGYNVCRDSRDGRMAKTWLEASGGAGIPQAFVVDAKVRLAWLGHPAELDDVLGGIVDGTFNAEVHDREVKADEGILDEMRAAMKAGTWPKALAVMDGCTLATATARDAVQSWRFEALLHVDLAKAEAEYERRAGLGADAQEEAASTILEVKGLPKAWYLRAADWFKAQAATKPEYFQSEAMARFLAKDPQGAAAAQASYLDWLKGAVAKELEKEPREKKQLEAMLRNARAELKRYRSAH